ncbi:MAG: exo-alpha-sialidase [Bacteroidetes bacterium]|nr:exo-alpha-sialidase [Bacteroidota bacterium]
MSLILLFCITASFAQSKRNIVFESGSEGYNSYRIPAMIRLPNGALLAFCEGRVSNAADFGNVDILMKTSKDDGQTWGSLKIIVDNGLLQAGNPAPVLDMKDPAYPNGRIFLFYNTGGQNENEIRKGHGIREVWYKTSIDDGITWSAPVNITTQVHRPNQPQMNAAYHFDEDWRSYANTPGHAIQFSEGIYAGRIYVAANHSAGNPQAWFKDYRAHGYYTDDHGKTFHLSEVVDVQGSNESMAAELSQNKLMLNIRNQQGNVKARIIAVSLNGGESWDEAYFDRNLPDPVCQGSILSIKTKRAKRLLVFCNNADTSRRDHLTLRVSADEGITWDKSYLIDKSTDEFKGDFTGYSDLVELGKKKIGILYERNNYHEIVFTSLVLK